MQRGRGMSGQQRGSNDAIREKQRKLLDKHRKTYTKIWGRREKRHRYTMFPHEQTMKLLMRAMYYDVVTYTMAKTLYQAVSKAKAKWEPLLDLNAVAYRLDKRESKDFGDALQTILLITLALGFHVEPGTLLVYWPERTARKYYEALYFVAVTSYKERVVKTLGHNPQEEKAYSPGVTPGVFSGRSMINFANSVYSLALSTGMTYDPTIFSTTFKKGVFKTAPIWFNTVLVSLADIEEKGAAPPQPLRKEFETEAKRIEEIVETTAVMTRTGCEAEKTALKETYTTEIGKIQEHLEESKKETDRVKVLVTSAQQELEDVRQKWVACTNRLESMGDPEAPSEALQGDAEIGDVDNRLSEAEEAIKKVESSNAMAEVAAENAPDEADANAVQAKADVLRDITSGDLLRNLKRVRKAESNITEDDTLLINDTVKVMLQGSAWDKYVKGVRGEEEEEEEEEGGTAGGAIGTSIRSDRRRTKTSSHRKSKGKKYDRNKLGIISPTRTHFADVYDTLQ